MLVHGLLLVENHILEETQKGTTECQNQEFTKKRINFWRFHSIPASTIIHSQVFFSMCIAAYKYAENLKFLSLRVQNLQPSEIFENNTIAKIAYFILLSFMYVFNCSLYCVSWNCFACTFVIQLIKINQSINQYSWS